MTVPQGPAAVPDPAGAAPALLERQAELDAIATAVSATAHGSGGLVLVEGEPGIGKSSLVSSAIASARDQGLAVLSASANELEREHPYGVLTDLFLPLLRRADTDLFDGPADAARRLLLASPEAGPVENADPHAALHALYWLTLNLVDRSPLLLAVDDAQWGDEASLRYLAYLANRVPDLPVAIVLALRPARADEDVTLQQLRHNDAALHLRPRPLSEESVAVLLERQRRAAASDHDAAVVHRLTGGNPFYVLTLARMPGDVASMPGTPSAVDSGIRRELAAMGPGGREVAEAFAVLGDNSTIDRVARMVTMDVERAASLARGLVDRGILSGAVPPSFVHPIIQSAVYEAMPPMVRSSLHRAAARILQSTGASAGAVATQLIHSAPSGDQDVVDWLVNAARTSLAQGDPGGAVTFLRRALAEPPTDERRGRVLLQLAEAEAAAGTPGAVDRFEDAIRAIEEPHERARARLAQGHALIAAARWRDAAGAFAAGLADVDARALELQSKLEAGWVSSCFVGLVDHEAATERLRRILAAPLNDPAHRELAAWTAFQHSVTLAAPAAEVARLARRALEGVPLESLVRDSQIVELAGGALIAAGDLDDEIAMLDRAIEAAGAQRAFGKVGLYAYCRSIPHHHRGDLQDAIADAQMALAAHEHGWEVFYPGTCSSLSWSLLEVGDVEGAARAVAIDDERWSDRLDFQFMVRIARARVALERGQVDDALRHLEDARAAGAALGISSPSTLADWRTWYAIALRAAGRNDEAAGVGHEVVELARRWGAPMAVGRALTALGVATGRDGIDSLREAVDVLGQTSARLDRARAWYELGAALRRVGRAAEAREALASAADLAHQIGARTILERARAELVAVGARPRRYAVSGVDSLTPSELRVARLVATGRTNREVAQSLFVTPKAVEYHLANAYRKLGIGGRADLPGALSDAGGAASV